MPVYRLDRQVLFPPAHLAEDGLLAVGGDLSPRRLLAAYRGGIFPWFNEDQPILWWSPDPRMVLFPERIHLSHRLRRTLKSGCFEISADTAFGEVIRACAQIERPGQDGTWIVASMIEAYENLHELGYAHSMECRLEGALAGGLYGVSIGGCFFGESMFSRSKDASKIALAALAGQCRRWGIGLVDCQMATPHLYSMGAREMPRPIFLDLLRRALRKRTLRGPWRLDGDIVTAMLTVQHDMGNAGD